MEYVWCRSYTIDCMFLSSLFAQSKIGPQMQNQSFSRRLYTTVKVYCPAYRGFTSDLMLVWLPVCNEQLFEI